MWLFFILFFFLFFLYYHLLNSEIMQFFSYGISMIFNRERVFDLVNGQHLYRAFIQSTLTICLSFIHSHILTQRPWNHARHLANHSEQLGLSVLLKDTWTRGQEEPGIEPPIDAPLCILSTGCPKNGRTLFVSWFLEVLMD